MFSSCSSRFNLPDVLALQTSEVDTHGGCSGRPWVDQSRRDRRTLRLEVTAKERLRIVSSGACRELDVSSSLHNIYYLYFE